jgi:hypothetical protein
MLLDEVSADHRAVLGKLPEPIYADSDSSETAELVGVLNRIALFAISSAISA